MLKKFRFRRIGASTLRVLRQRQGNVHLLGSCADLADSYPMDEPLGTYAPLEPKHYRAICDEIGERLGHSLARDASPVPPRLRKLLGQFADLQGGAPSILPDRRDELTGQARV
jgi:hypothetical protein